MVPHDRFTDLRRPPSAIARSSTIEHDIMRRVREWMAGGPPPHGLPSLRQPPTARAVEDCLDETAVLMDRSQDVYARPHQLHSEVWNALDLIAEDTALGDEILPVDPSKFPHPVVERPLARWVRLD